MALAPLSLALYSTVDFSFETVMGQLPLPMPYCSIRIQYSGPPGSAVAEVSSVEQKSDMVIDSRLANEGDGWAGSGAHPWRLDDETDSVLFLTNMGDKDAPIGFQIQANGVNYYLTDLKLNRYETRAIDLRKLRDAQKPDFRGHKIPAAATDGSLLWIRLDNVRVMGRLVVLQRHRGIASNYDCNRCSCPADYDSCDIEPPPPACRGPHAVMQATCIATFLSCNGSPIYRNVTNTAVWTTSNGSVATFDPSKIGLLKAHAAGTVNMIVTYNGNTYSWDPSTNGCDATPDPSGYTCPISVKNSACPDHLQVVSDNYDYLKCTVSGLTVERFIKYDIVEANDVPVGNNYIEEIWYAVTSNTCGNGYPSQTTCGPAGSSITDHLTISCNLVGGTCGFTIGTQQWETCALNYLPVVLASLYNVTLQTNKVSVTANGTNYTVPPDSGKLPPGTNIYAY